MPWRPDLQPLRQRLRRLVDAPLPIGLPAIAFAALPARPPARAFRGAAVFASARRSTAWVGTELRRAAGPICRVSIRMEAFETGVIFCIGPGRRTGGEDGKKTIFLRTTPEGPT